MNKRFFFRALEMGRGVKGLSAKPDNPSSIPETHVVEESGFLQVRMNVVT